MHDSPVDVFMGWCYAALFFLAIVMLICKLIGWISTWFRSSGEI